MTDQSQKTYLFKLAKLSTKEQFWLKLVQLNLLADILIIFASKANL